MPTVFVVEDDRALRDELLRLLRLQGFTCATSEDYAHLVPAIQAAAPDCVVLDLKLPGTTGHDICRDLRRVSDVPIIMLTSSDSEFDELMSMNLGADDYVAKPYNPAILIARIHSVLRRAHLHVPVACTECQGVVLDRAKGTVTAHGHTVELARNEQKILGLLMESPGSIISRQEIMRELWSSDEFVDDNTLTVNVNRLRKSLAAIGVTGFLTTRRGQGYSVGGPS